TVGNNPVGVAVADFNNDTLPDIAVGNDGSNTLSILLNTTTAGAASPTFASAATYTAGDPRYIAVADLNEDGYLDVAVANFSNATVSVYINKGAAQPGAFNAQVAYASQGNQGGVATGDFDGDGNLDLVVSNYNGSQDDRIAFLKGNGDGTFVAASAANTFAVGASNPYGIAAADFKGDGKLDVATANDEYYNHVSVLFGNGNGTFASPAVYNFTGGNNYGYQITASDLNGDGKTDLIIGGNGDRFTVAYNRGNGTFAG